MKALIGNIKKWLIPEKTIDIEAHINWFGVINRVKDDAVELTDKNVNRKDGYNQPELELKNVFNFNLNSNENRVLSENTNQAFKKASNF